MLTFSAEKRDLHSELSSRGMIRLLLPTCWGECWGQHGGGTWGWGVLWPSERDQVPLPMPHSLPELLLYPSRRFEEYVHLLYALRLHTPAEHVDRGDLTTAIDRIKTYKGYIDQVGGWQESVSFEHVTVLFWHSSSQIQKCLFLLWKSSNSFVFSVWNHCIQRLRALKVSILSQTTWFWITIHVR